MPSVNFSLFKILWEKVKEKFLTENNEPFTLKNLNSKGIELKETDWNKIEISIAQGEGTKDINLSKSAYKVLYKYLEIEKLADLDTVIAELEKQRTSKLPNKLKDNSLNITEIGFLGRKNELSQLNNFLLDPGNRILELYGVPMIGKTELINYFLDNYETTTNFKVIREKLNPPPEDVEAKLKRDLFENRDFNDFSGFAENILIIIEGFEEVLNWTGNYRSLHDILDKYSNIKTFLKEITQIKRIKLIIESRFQINFPSFLSKVKPLVETIEIEGVEREEFWKFYQSRNFTRQEFEKLCNNFSNHTGLLALAYNNNFIYGKRLIDAVYRPKSATIYLWEYIESIIIRLEHHEILVLCALTLLKERIAVENLYNYLISPKIFNNKIEIDTVLLSLEKKMLIQVRREFYELNPYIREVCFTFLTEIRKGEMEIISNLPYFKMYGEKPLYNRIRQAQERGDYMYLIKIGKELRKAEKYDEAFEAIEAGLPINPKPEYVLNEKAICYRATGQVDKAIEVWNTLITKYKHLPAFNELAIYYRENKQTKKAIEILEQAEKIDSQDVKTLTELAICYSEEENYTKSIEVAERAISLGHHRCYTVLANTYQRMGDIEKAYQTVQAGIKTTNKRDYRLLEQAQELEELLGQQAKNINSLKPLKVFISYSHRDEDIKERLDTFLATLKREGKIETWNDRRIPIGDKWDNTIKSVLESSDIILLLISQDFIQSNYIWNTELPLALKMQERNEATVIPIFCREIDDFAEMPFAGLTGLPVNAVPISSPSNNRALSEVARGIRTIVTALQEKRSR